MKGTTYHVRAYADNSDGAVYGDDITFKTIMADADGNVYNSVTMGTQTWMVENLKQQDTMISVPYLILPEILNGHTQKWMPVAGMRMTLNYISILMKHCIVGMRLTEAGYARLAGMYLQMNNGQY